MAREPEQQGTDAEGERQRWAAWGAWLTTLEQRSRLSGREIARRLVINDRTWRNYKAGGTYKGRSPNRVWVLPSPEPYLLHRIGELFGVPAHEVFDRCGQTPGEEKGYDPFEAMAAIRIKMAELEQYLQEHRPVLPATQPAPRTARRPRRASG